MSLQASTSSFTFPAKACLSNNNDNSAKASGSTSLRWTLTGRSRAGDGTSFFIPELRWMFDCGAPILNSGVVPEHIFLTHTHSDHVTFLGHLLLRSSQSIRHSNLRKIVLHVPQPAVKFVRNYMLACQRMNDMDDTKEITVNDDEGNLEGGDQVQEQGEEEAQRKSDENGKQKPIAEDEPCWIIEPVHVGKEIYIRPQKGNSLEYVVTPVECDHRVTCYGYSIFVKTKTLREEFRALPGPQLGYLRKTHIKENTLDELYDFSLLPVLCYLGDSTPKVFEKHPEILQQHHTVVTECTFLNERDQAKALQTQHTHWLDLQPIVEAHPHVLFALTHFSLKHSSLEVLKFFHEQPTAGTATNTDGDEANGNVAKDPAASNIHPILISHEITAQWRKQQYTGGNGGEPPLCKCMICTGDAPPQGNHKQNRGNPGHQNSTYNNNKTNPRNNRNGNGHHHQYGSPTHYNNNHQQSHRGGRGGRGYHHDNRGGRDIRGGRGHSSNNRGGRGYHNQGNRSANNRSGFNSNKNSGRSHSQSRSSGYENNNKNNFKKGNQQIDPERLIPNFPAPAPFVHELEEADGQS